MTSHTLFATWPYLAATSFTLALALRCLRARGPLLALRAEAARGWAELRGGPAWRLGMAALAAGHLLCALAPAALLRWNASPARLHALEALALGVGLAAAAGWAVLWARALGRRGRATAADVADGAFLTVLGLAIASGLLTAVLHRWGSSWGAILLGPYGRSLLRGQPLADLPGRLPFLVQLHVTAAFAALALAPLTRLGPALVLTVHAPIRAVGAGLAAAKHSLRVVLGRLQLGARLWPDED